MIRMILSILFPDRGELSVLGRKSALEAKDRIGYLPEERGLYKRMRVGEFLLYMARLKGLDGVRLRGEVRKWLERVDLADCENKRCQELSKGMQQKVQFVAAVIHRPDLLILDEPFSGLDPVNQRHFRDLVLDEHRRGATIIFSTHIMTHAEQLCDHVVMIHRGRKVLDRATADIREAFDPHRILFEPLDPASDPGAIRALPGVASVVAGRSGLGRRARAGGHRRGGHAPTGRRRRGLARRDPPAHARGRVREHRDRGGRDRGRR